ncbi:MAG TPA: CPBP family intramembrane glutamic endopeptidase [Candidatus Saccharimonadales bacterium]|nr:CPBP family intramembrane glutamic endopeptidase [Candidatus Saccharimonadales bacterium]
MSKDSSNQPPASAHPVESPEPRQWGFWAIILGILAFLGSQVVIGAIAYGIAGKELSTSAQFYTYGGSSLLTLALLSRILRRYHATFRDLGLRAFKPKFIGYAAVALPVYIVLSGLTTKLATSVQPHFNLDQKQDLGFTGAHSIPELVMVFASLVLLPPLLEELLFRGFIFKGALKHFHPIVAALFTSVLFGAAHGQWNVGLDTFSLSLVLCFLAYKTKSLWPGIVLHASKNCIAFFYVFIVPLVHSGHF